MNERLSNILMIVAVGCAVVTTTTVVRRGFDSAPPGPAPQGTPVPGWREFATGAHVRGPANAPVVIVEFFDFQCPACRRMSFTLDTVLARGEPSIRLIRRHFPLQGIHPRAHELARAGVCAEQQGVFDSYYRTAFDKQVTTLAADWSGPLALMPSGIDVERFERCLTDPATARVVEGDVQAGSAIGLTATPSLLINGKLYRGSRPVAGLDSLIALPR